jgi:predicted nucleic acid-binding protein
VSSRRWVVNASPVILLGDIGQLHLLETLCDALVVPVDVAREVQNGPIEDAAQRWLRSSGRAYISEKQPVDASVAGWDLGAGENAVLMWARTNPGYEAILDDRAARSCAEALRIPVRGTLGVLLVAKREGLIEAMRPALESLVQAGLRITPEVAEAALSLAEEV